MRNPVMMIALKLLIKNERGKRWYERSSGSINQRSFRNSAAWKMCDQKKGKIGKSNERIPMTNRLI